MSQFATCPRCQSPLAADAPEGLCPACLLAGGMASERSPNSGSAATTPWTDAKRAAAIADLAPHFPQLEIIELLGQGGMGAVYKARQKHLDRLIALKVIPPEAAKEPAFAERFAREARALARLNHPNIVTVHDFGQSDGVYFLLMEFVDGLNLRQTMRAGKLSPQEALAIVPHICEALQYAHDQGIVHRDVKPENVLLDKAGRVKIADFGLAKLLTHSPQDYTLTHSMQVMGTPRYMAPEQIEKPTEVDHRADIYSLGVMFYEMLTGEIPMGRFVPPSQKVQIDIRIDEIVLRTLEREPARRYQHASDVKTDIETLHFAPRGPSRMEASVAVEDPRFAPGRQLYWSGMGLVVGGSLGLLTCMVLGGLSFELHTRPPYSPSRTSIAIGYLEWAAILVPWSMLVFVGGMKVLRLESYRLSLIGICVSLLPISPASLLTIPVGFWALAILLSRQGREAYELQAVIGLTGKDAAGTKHGIDDRILRETRSQLHFPGIGMIVAGGLGLLFCLYTFMAVPGMSLYAGILVPWSLLIAIAGIKMRQTENYWLSVVGSSLALLPISPASLISMPAGLWSLVILMTRQVREAFRKQELSTPRTVGTSGLGKSSNDSAVLTKPPSKPNLVAISVATSKHGLYWPGMGLQAAGIIGFVPLVVMLGAVGVVCLGYLVDSSNHDVWARRFRFFFDDMGIGPVWFAMLPQVPSSVLLLISGRTMRHMTHYRLALISSIVAMIPCGPAWLISLPLGIWAVMVLTTAGVRERFQDQPVA
ncbi:MAG: serine/threonine-protein kinase [Pirellulaceae bacterium]